MNPCLSGHSFNFHMYLKKIKHLYNQHDRGHEPNRGHHQFQHFNKNARWSWNQFFVFFFSRRAVLINFAYFYVFYRARQMINSFSLISLPVRLQWRWSAKVASKCISRLFEHSGIIIENPGRHFFWYSWQWKHLLIGLINKTRKKYWRVGFNLIDLLFCRQWFASQ